MSEQTITPLKSEKESGFTREEREEIIRRLQVVENVCAGLSAQVTDMIGELFPMSEPTDDEPFGHRVNMTREVHAFCVRLSAVLDALGGNPMFAAMLPADAIEALS